MRQRPRYTATIDPHLLAKLDLAKGPVPRSDMVEAAVRFTLEFYEDVKRMKETYEKVTKNRYRVTAPQ
jgi:metal-responsive CopG/Arc/MetJ family transcriptional regulator